MKVVNPNYKKIPLVPLDISLRDDIGYLSMLRIRYAPDVVRMLLDKVDEYKEHITAVVRRTSSMSATVRAEADNTSLIRLRADERNARTVMR